VKNIGIINCHDVSRRCSSSGCLKALHDRTGAFARYTDEELRIVSFVHCNGCGDGAVERVVARARRMREVGVDVIHLSTCVQSRCPEYGAFLAALGGESEVVGATHGKKRR
jgi:predicted metal-binding protein